MRLAREHNWRYQRYRLDRAVDQAARRGGRMGRGSQWLLYPLRKRLSMWQGWKPPSWQGKAERICWAKQRAQCFHSKLCWPWFARLLPPGSLKPFSHLPYSQTLSSLAWKFTMQLTMPASYFLRHLYMSIKLMPHSFWQSLCWESYPKESLSFGHHPTLPGITSMFWSISLLS